MPAEEFARSPASVDLYWLPLGAGDNTHCVRTNGRIFEWFAAHYRRRERLDLYHSALEVRTGRDRFIIEMAPVWRTDARKRGVVAEGPVGLRRLGRSQLFRYEVRCWRDGAIPDVAEAVESPQRLSTSSPASSGTSTILGHDVQRQLSHDLSRRPTSGYRDQEFAGFLVPRVVNC